MIRKGNVEYAGETYKIYLLINNEEKLVRGRNVLKEARELAANWERSGSEYTAVIENSNRPDKPVQTRSTFWNQK